MYLNGEELTKVHMIKGAMFQAVREKFKYICTDIVLDRKNIENSCEIAFAWNIGKKRFGFRTIIPAFLLKDMRNDEFVCTCEMQCDRVIFEISKMIVEEINKDEEK